MKFILSTRNTKKVEELGSVLNKIGHELIPLETYEIEKGITVPEVEEIANSFYGNALLKAEALFKYCSDSSIGVIADDSGLVVPLLKGKPGVYSARYAGVDGDDRIIHQANIDKLHLELCRHSEYQGKTPAYFITVIVLLIPKSGERREIVGEGRCWGKVISELRGVNGFGYDPVFIPNESKNGLTFSEMEAMEKNAISHRARAIKSIINKLKEE